jgi:exopolysaccharide biosynthesis protein
MIRDLAVDDGPNFHATAKLADVKVALGDHVLHGLHGKLIAVGDGVGTADVEGFLDNVTFRADGEVHDLRSHYRWLAQGTNDLQSLAKLATTIAAEPQLRGPVELEAIAPGLSLGQYHLLGEHGPLAISVLSADPTEKTLRFDTAIAGDHVISNGERTSSMGVRTGAVAGVNGDYFDIGRTYQPQGMLVSGGELVRGPTDRAVATIDRNMHATFGEFHMTGTLETAHGKERVTEFNDWPPGYVSVITPRYGVELKPGAATFVELAPLGGSKYRVANVTPGDQTIPVSFGVAIGRSAKIPMPKIGETVKLTYATDPPLGGAVMAIGGGPILVKDSTPYDDPHAPAPDERDVRWPVVALAQTKDARLDLIAVDGRHPERSIGMTRPEFAELLERFGATDAMALDSGGSVTLVARTPGDANVTVRNVVSDFSNERWISDALYLYSSAPQPSIVTPKIATTPLPEERPTP